MKTADKNLPKTRNSFVYALTLRGGVSPMKDRRMKRQNRKSWKKDMDY